MPQFLVQMAAPENPTSTNMGGLAATFPFAVVLHEAVGTPLQTASSTPGRITARITGSLLAVWNLPVEAVLKIMAFVLRGHVAKYLANTGQLAINATVEFSTHDFPGPCPFDIALLEELPGSPQSVAINRPIGFVHGA